MLRRFLTIGSLLAVLFFYVPGPAFGASGRVALPLNHRLNGILVDLYSPKLFFGHERVSRGFVATRDGLVLAPLAGLEKADFGDEIKLQWMDKRSAQGWIVWKDEEVGFVIVRILDPMPLFPAVGWHRHDGLKPGDRLFAPGPLSGGRPTLSKAVVADLQVMSLPSGRHISRTILLTPSLGAGPLGGPLLDDSGTLVGMVSSLAPPPGFRPDTVVAVPLDTLQPDLRAARGMRLPRRYTSPPALARPSYRIGIGIGSGGVHPSIGVGLGGLGGYGTVRRRRDPWAHREDPYLRREQEVTDQAKTEALEQALEQRSGLESGGNAPLLTNSQPLPQEQTSPGAPDSWRAGASSVASATGSGEVKEARPEAYRRPKPAIGSTWNPAGPPLATSPAPSKGGAWPVVVQPKITPSVKAKQQASDRAKTEELEKQLDQQGVEGSPVGSPSGEFRVLAASPSSSSGKPSFGSQESELAVLRARNKALEQELEMLKKSISGSQ